MHAFGIDTVFTGESGTLSYFLFISLGAFVYCVRVATAKGSRAGGSASIGFALLLGSRWMHATSLVATNPGVMLPAQIAAIIGLYFIFQSVLSLDGNPTGRREFVLWGLASAVLLGGASFVVYVSVVSVGAVISLLTLLVTFAPVGMLAGTVRVRNRILPVSAGFFLVGATVVTSLVGLRFVSDEPFWHQIVALGDLAGVFLYVAAALLGDPDERAARNQRPMKRMPVSCECGDWGSTPIELMVGIDSSILSEERGQNVLQRVVDVMAEQINADLIIVRLAKPGNELYEVSAHYGLSETKHMHTAGLSISRDDFEDLCHASRAHDIGYIVEWDDCASRQAAFMPPEIDWSGSKVLVLPIHDRGMLIAFFMIGFFAENPPADAIPILRFYANRVLTVIQIQRVNEKLLEKERTLALYKEELESVNQLKSNFMSIVSHELRTPLTSIKAYTETLLDNIDAIQRQTIQEFLTVMNEENERLIKLVDNILNYSRMESGNLKVEKASCDLNAMIEGVNAALGKKILAGNVNMDIRLPKRSVRIDADVELIRQLLNNLISNAVKFTPEGGKVTVLLEEEASAARIVVQDTGKGIPEDQLEKIFERFHQVDTSNTREHGGSGLGLAICKNIVDWHDGKIWVENVKEAGAKFVVLLPMKDIYVRHAPAVGYIGSRRFEREKYLTLLVELIAEFLQAKKSSIMILDQEQQILKVIAAKGLDPEFVQNTRLEVGDRIAGRVAMTGEALHVFDIEEDGDYGRANNSAFYGTHSFISVPLKSGDDVLGVLNVSDHVEGREFTKADREILESLGIIIVTMLKKLDAYEAVSSNFERLKDAMRSVLDIREAWGGKNLSNLTLLALKIGELLDLDDNSLTALRLGMNMYDLGLMKIPRNIRSKKEQLSQEEIARLRSHTNIGYALVSPMGLEERIMKMIRSHHEYYDGTGYPDGLAGTEIPIEARIVNVVDSFRALVSEGPYRRCFSIDEARKEIIKSAGAKFDPRVVGAFVKALRDLGVREYKGELILDSVEHELEQERRARRKGELQQRETVKEGAP